MTTVVYKINPKDSEEFEWDSNKATSNLQKHGITFQTAAKVFLDPFAVVTSDVRYSEERSQILGYSCLNRLLLVVFVERGTRNRIISARPATRAELKLYESDRAN